MLASRAESSMDMNPKAWSSMASQDALRPLDVRVALASTRAFADLRRTISMRLAWRPT